MKERELTKIRTAIKKTIPLLAAALFLAGLFSCSDDPGSSSGQPGRLALQLNADTTFRQSVSTKAVEDEFQDFLDPDGYTVSILQEENSIKHYATYREMPDEIALEAGAYTLKAHKGENVAGAFLSPYFEGTMNFSIESEMRTPIEVTCRLANTRVTVGFEEDFLEAYPSYAVHFLTPYLTDTLTVEQEEERAAYFRSDATGTDLEIILQLQRLEDDNIYYYKPQAIPIEPRQNVNLLFKTDGEAINGIGLTVTLNNDLDETVTLDMTIPEYAWGDVEVPTFGKDRFELEINDISYSKLQNKEDFYYLDYIVPASVGQAILEISRTENGATTTDQYDLATEAGASAARQLGITLTDQANEQTYQTAREIKNGRIHFTDALARLAPSKNEVAYTYTLYIIDALPVNPNSSDTTTMQVNMNAVAPSVLTGTNATDQTLPATQSLASDIGIEYNTDAGIKTATLEVYRNGTIAGSYNVTTDNLPAGIVYDEGKLTFARSFVRSLTVDPGREETYTFVLSATDRMDEAFTGSPLSFEITLQPVFEIIVPTEEIWAWKAKAVAHVSGLTEQNRSSLSVSIAKEGTTNYVTYDNYTVTSTGVTLWFEHLDPNQAYQAKITYNEMEKVVAFTTENSVQVANHTLETWSIANKQCKARSILTTSTVNIPFPSVDSWTTNNAITATNTTSAGSLFTTDPYPGLSCFPTVVYETKDGGKAAVIRTIDATTNDKNGKARGELSYNGSLASRPSSVSFDYAFNPYDEENFVVTVQVLSGGEVIGTAGHPSGLGASSDYTTTTIPITYQATDKKATDIRILFASSDASSPGVNAAASLTTFNYQGTSTTYTSVKYGSTLKIDNVTLNYAE